VLLDAVSCCFLSGMREQWGKPDILAQASGSRLRDSIRNPSKLLRKLSFRRRAPVLSKKSSRLGKEVSAKRENVKAPLFHYLSSRLGERSSLERENLSSLSKCFLLERDLCMTCSGAAFLYVFSCWLHD